MEVEIVVPRSGLTDVGLEGIGESLAARDCVVRKVDVSFNKNITDTGFFYLAKGLASNHSVRSLHLNGVGLTDRGLDVLAKSLQGNSTLHTLSIKGTKVTEKGLQSFAKSVGLHNQTLKTLETSPHLPPCEGLRKKAKEPPKVGEKKKNNNDDGNSWCY